MTPSKANALATGSENNEVLVFLQNIKLEKYMPKLLENGIEDMETLMELKDEHLEQLGIPLGHKLKIVKRIKDLKAERGADASSMSIKSTTESIKYSEGVSSRPVTQNVYEELPPPTEYYKPAPPKPVRAPVKALVKRDQASNQNIGMVDLKDGVYNEVESHNEFLDALNAWRNSGKPEKKKKWEMIEEEKKI